MFPDEDKDNVDSRIVEDLKYSDDEKIKKGNHEKDAVELRRRSTRVKTRLARL